MGVFVDGAGDDGKGELLGLARLAEEVMFEAFLRTVAEPFLDGQAVASRLADLAARFVEEQLVWEAGGRAGALAMPLFARMWQGYARQALENIEGLLVP